MQRPLRLSSFLRLLLPGTLVMGGAGSSSAQFTTQHYVDTVPGSGGDDRIRRMGAFDVEGDGDLDIFMAQRIFFGDAGRFVWYENLDGAGSFSGPNDILSTVTGGVVWDFDLADEDGDGDLDLVYVTGFNGNVRVRHFDNGAFGPEEIWSDQYGLYVRWAQLDPWNDNLPDIALHQEWNMTHVLYNQGGSFSAPVAIGSGMSGLGPDWMDAGDFTGNLGDIVVWIASKVYVHSLIDDGEGGGYWQTNLVGYCDVEPQSVDINGDGLLDIGMCGADTIHYYAGLQYIPQHFYSVVSIEPEAGAGTFGNVDCDPYIDVFFHRTGDPEIIFGNVGPGLGNGPESRDFDLPVPATGLPSGGYAPLLADLDSDGVNDLVVAYNDSLYWYTNDGWELQEVTLPLLDTLCMNSSGYVLPEAQPPGGTWYGQGVTEGVFSAEGLGTGDLQVFYEGPASAQCPVTAATVVHVINTPTVTSTPDNWTPCSFIPVQFHGAPTGGEWIGLTDANGLVQLTPGLNGVVQYSYTDPTGGTCTGIGAIIDMSEITVANIGYSGPYCLNTDEYEVIPVVVGNPGNFFVYNWVDSIDYITSGVGNIYYMPDTLGLDTLIIGSNHAGFCPTVDTLVIEVVAPPEVTIAAFSDTLANTCASSYPLVGGLPEGGTYSGTGVSGGFFAPQGLLGDIDITYSYSSGACSASATGSIYVIEGISVSPNVVDQCVSNVPVQLEVEPQPEGWFNAIVSPTNVLNTAQPFQGSVYCTWSDVTGCQLYGGVSVNLRAYSEGYVNTSGLDPVPEQVCMSTSPFGITTSLANGGEQTTSFDPQAEGLGDYEFVGYAADDGSGCLRNDTLAFTVVDAPLVELAPFSDTLLSSCETSTYLLTQGSPAGGTYSGDGVADGYFHPIGSNSDTPITYSYSFGTGCEGSATGVIHTIGGVASEPFGPLETIAACVGDAPVQMVSYPNGQAWSGGPAITPNGYIDMSAPYSGPISFTYTDAAGCSASLSIGTFIGAYILGTVTIPEGDEVVCADEEPFNISWSTSDGIGVDSLFDPAAAGPGTYYFTGQGVIEPGPTQCYQDVTDSVVVLGNPVVTLDLSDVALLTLDAPYTLTEGSPEGGTYSGNFVTGGVFDPAAAGPGWHTIDYTVTNADLCSTTATDSIHVELFDGVSAEGSTPSIRVWPVPAQDRLNMALPAQEASTTLTLFDAHGREVSSRTIPPGPTGRIIHLETHTLDNGTYTLFVRGLAHTSPVRVIIAH